MKFFRHSLLCCALVYLVSCSTPAGAFFDGSYTAEMADFDKYGWKECISITVNGGRIAVVEFNAKNASGFIKSWDPDYMRLMNAASGVYPNKYTRLYATSLLESQDPAQVDAISGASDSGHTFVLLAEAVLAQARTGTRRIVKVKAP